MSMVEMKREELIQSAIKVMQNAYCPYSKFRVGTAVLTEDGHIFVGANVESASYPCGWCAEVSAVAAAVSQGHRRLIACAITASTETIVGPCGRCRQVLVEFATDLEMPVFLRNSKNVVKEMSVGELLPLSFNGSELRNT